MKKNRHLIVVLFFLVAFLILLSRLFSLTIIQGDNFREFSDNNRIKQVNIDAARGIIYDRNGKELATNKSMYNLNAYKDRFNDVEIEERKKILGNLVKILDEDGVNYLSDFEFGIYEYQYNDNSKYFSQDKLPDERIVEIIKENNLLDEILRSSIKINSEIDFYPVKRMIDYIALRGRDLPIEIDLEKDVNVKFIENTEYTTLLKNGKISENTDALTFFIDNVKDNDNFISYLISHPLSRKIVYDILYKKNLSEDIILSDIIYSADKNFIEHKSYLHTISNKISLDSDAKSDFLNLVKSSDAVKNILTKTYSDNGRIVVPASILINMIEKKNVNTNISFKVNEENQSVDIEYIENKNDSIIAIDTLISLANKYGVIDDFILSKDILSYVQSSLFSLGIYPRIYLSSWEYSYLKDKEDLLSKYAENKKPTAKELFYNYKENNLLNNHSDYFSFGIINILNEIDSRGYLAYIPITIAKNINKDSVAKIEEVIPKNSGIEVVAESNRYYPNTNTSSHLLGYIGSISEDFEIEEYIEYKQYDYNDRVGKSGVEESFEDTLRGLKGKRLVYTDVYGRTTDIIEETNAIPGNNLYLSIDLDFQKEVEKILEDIIYSISSGENYHSYYGDYSVRTSSSAKIGSAVVMDTKTGQILAMASKPDYDPNLFVNGISNYDWKKLNDSNPKDLYAPRPILNNVLQSAFTPGSTFKTVTSLAALENGLDPEDTINSFGYIDVGDNRFNELIYTLHKSSWGRINLYDALKVSSNYYFYVLGLGYNPNEAGDNDIIVSLEDIESITSRLGLQSKTNIEINYPVESSGYSPNLYGKRNILKASLEGILRKDLRKYIKPGVNLLETKFEDDISTILSWIDIGPEMTRYQIIEKLENMQYDSELIIDGNRETLPDIIKYSFVNMAVWTESDSVNMVIGQGQNAYTPMQMVQLAAIIANEGKLVRPTIVSQIKNYNNTQTIFTQSTKSTETGVDSEHFKHVKEGMRRASTEATFRNQFPFEIGSKTGTAELTGIDPDTGENYKDYVSEMAFAPFDNPEIAIYISVVEGGASTNVRIANNDIIYAYYKYVKDDPTFNRKRIGEISEKSTSSEINDNSLETLEDTQFESTEQ